MTIAEQIAKIEAEIQVCDNNMQRILRMEGCAIPEQLTGSYKKEYETEFGTRAVLQNYITSIECICNSALRYVDVNLS
jgi:hypothetical protein